MAGGKGGSSTTEVAVPEYIEEAARRNLNKAEGISQIGYTPYYGPDVAAFTPMQEAAFQNTADVASAFGLSGGDMSAQDLRGGVDAPTTYAGGVRGYSSAPMYEQSLEELGRQRPGQKNYIDSFFIDPVTGAAGSNVQPMIDYTDFETMAESGRRSEAAERAENDATRSNDLAIARANAGPEAVYYDYNNETYNTSAPANTYITNPADGITDTSTPSGFEGFRNDVGEFVVGNTAGLFVPSYKAGAINNPIKTPTVEEMVSAVPDGMDYNPSTGSYTRTGSPAPTTSVRPISREDAASDEADTGETKVICTALHDLGRLSDEVYALDAKFGFRVNKEDPMLGDGYRLWATPVANYIKGDSLGSKAALAIVAPIATAWAAEMAHVMRPDEYKSNFAGRVLMAVGHPLCRMIGRVFLPQMNKEAV